MGHARLCWQRMWGREAKRNKSIMGSRQKLNTRTFSSPSSRRRATTLIEVIIASAFVLLIATGAMELSIRVMREHATVSRQGELDSESMLVLQAVMHDLTAAQRIETAPTSATLSLRTKDATGKTWTCNIACATSGLNAAW